MSVFEDRGTPVRERRTLFWLICIWVRLLIATSFAVFTLDGRPWVAYVLGSIGVLAGLNFWRQMVADAGPNIWWHRSVHGTLWVGGGLSAIILRAHGEASDAAAAIAVFFFGDVLFGVITALAGRPSWAGTSSTQPLRRVRWWATSDSENALFTAWSLAHLASGSGLGVASYYASPPAPWVGCLFASLLIVLWEAFENVNLDIKFKLFGIGDIDSDANLASDLVVGLTGVWATAYALRLSIG